MIPMTSENKKISTLLEHSAYATRWLSAQSQWVEGLLAGQDRYLDGAHIDEILAPVHQLLAASTIQLEELGAQLRLSRQRLMLLLALRDLSGDAGVPEVTQAMTLFAEKVVAIGIGALRRDMRELVGEPLDA